MSAPRRLALAALLLSGAAPAAGAQDGLSGTVELEATVFPQPGLHPAQERLFPSAAVEVSWARSWSGGAQRVVATGFARYDPVHAERTRADVREAYWQGRSGGWELSAGARRAFWGVAESVHPVDVLNQRDVLESPGLEEKLGQPMLQLTRRLEGGTLDLHLLPYFRTRELPRARGRFRPPFSLEGVEPEFESAKERWRPGWALRWHQSSGPAEFALSHYWGTDPEPELRFPGGGGPPRAYYDVVHRSGLELQLSAGPTLWKLEGAVQIANRAQEAFVAGVEHTVGDVLRSGRDLALLLEYAYDSRGAATFTGMDDDFFAAARLSWNDAQGTEALVGVVKDRTRGTALGLTRTSRRFAGSWRWELEARGFLVVSPEEFVHAFRRDGYARLAVARHF